MPWICGQCKSEYDQRLERCPLDNSPLVEDLSGVTIAGRYTLQELIGVGGMSSSVWRAWQASTCRAVAVKIFPPAEKTSAERFARGGRIASNLNHPHIVIVHDYGQTEDGKLYLVMELLEGHTLDRLLKEGQEIPLPRVLLIGDQILRALEHAHANRVVHRDLKPANLFLVNRDDNPFFVKVLDFGVSKYISGEGDPEQESLEITQEGEVCGTPLYMAPEQILSRKADPRTDIYAVGVILYRLLTGRFPFQASTRVQLLRQILTQPPPKFAEAKPGLALPQELEALILKALSKQPSDRFSSAREMRHALRAIRHSLKIYSEESDDSMSFISPSSEVRGKQVATIRTPIFSQTESDAFKKPKPLWIYGVLGGGLVFVLGVILFFVLSSRDNMDSVQPPLESKPDIHMQIAVQPPPMKEDKQKTDFISVKIDSYPQGADIRWRGQSMGVTPLDVKMPRGFHTINVSKDGFISETVNIDLSNTSNEETVNRFVTLKAVTRIPSTPITPPKPVKTTSKVTKHVEEANVAPPTSPQIPPQPTKIKIKSLDENQPREVTKVDTATTAKPSVKIKVLDENVDRHIGVSGKTSIEDKKIKVKTLDN